MKPREKKAISDVQRLSPGAAVRLFRRYKTVHSEIFILNVEGDGELPQQVFVKYANSDSPQEITNQFKTQSEFHDRCAGEIVGAPRPLYLDSQEKMIVMEYIGGTSLKQALLKTRPGSFDWRQLADWSATALSRFHQVFARGTDAPIRIDSPELEENVDGGAIAGRLTGCNIQARAGQFVDFGAWNVIFHGRKPGVFLVDFPGAECICTPHLDLARFKFSLKVIKQYPQFRFIKMDWWHVDPFFDQFLRKYGDKTGVQPNQDDLGLIAWLEGEYGRRLSNIYRTSGLNVKLAAERLYMRNFTRSISGARK
jgi:hypothetical protein